MIHASRRLPGWLARLGVALLVLLAVLITALRLALPVADRYRGDLTRLAEEQLKYPLAVDTLSLRLAGWSPRLVLGGVVITNPQTGEALLRLRALELDLDLWASLTAGRPRVSALTLIGARLTLLREPDGRLALAGLTGLRPDDPGALALFLRQGRLDLTDSAVLIADASLGGPLVRLARARLRLINDGPVHRFELQAEPESADEPADGLPTGPLADPAPARLRVIGDLRGNPTTPAEWSGTLYLELAGADLGALWPRGLSPADRPSMAGQVRLESWNQLHAGSVSESLNRVALRGLVLPASAGPGSAPGQGESGAPRGGAPAPATAAPPGITLDHLDGLVRVARADAGWRVQTADLGFAVDGAPVADLGLDLWLAADGPARMLDLAVRDLDLRALARLSAAWPAALAPPGPLDPGLLAALDPRGHLGPLALRLASPADAPPTWQALAEVRGLALRPVGRLPGLNTLDARLRADQDGGRALLTGTAVVLDLRPLFDPPLELDRLGGELAWQRAPAGGWQVAATGVQAARGTLEGQAHFTLDLPVPGDATGPVLDLGATITHGDVTQTRRWLPVGILAPRLTDWLTRALAAGTLTRGDLLLRGPLHDYPFRAGEGRYDLTLAFEDLTLRYLPGWPPLAGAVGELHFRNQGLDIRLERGQVLETSVTAATATIPDLWHPRLAIHAEGQGPFADGLRIIRETPLAARLAPAVEALTADGRARLALDLELPLATDAPPGVAGRLTWPQPAGLGLKGTPIELTGLTGQLHFDTQGVRAEALGARLWGRPITVSLRSGPPVAGTGPAAAGAVTRVQVRTRLPVGLLAARLPSPFWRLASGELDCDLGIEVPQADPGAPRPPLGFTFASDLRGLALDLPSPLGKTAARANPLRLRGTLDPGRTLALDGTLAPLAWDLRLDLGAPQPRLASGRVTLGGGPASPPTAPGLAIDGTLETLSLPDLSDWWERTARTPGGASVASLGSAVGPITADLRIARLALGGIILTQARVQATQAGTGWDLRLAAREAGGQIRLPAAAPGPGPGAPPAAPLGLDLDDLDLKALLPAAGAATGPAVARAAGGPGSPARRPPALQLRIAKLRWGEAGLGRLELELRPDAGGFRVPRIRFEGLGETRVTGDADWLAGPGEGRGRVALDLRSADTGPLLRALDYAPLLSRAPVDARLNLSWPGAFEDFALERAAGRIELDVGPGRIPDVDPGVGRVLGFLNLGELRRRLTLDFTDLYQQGFVFERITGRIEVGGGLARLTTFDIDGPASDIRIGGTANLRTRTFDQRVTVEPSIGTSVALASGVAGGPAVGAAVYLVDRLSGGALDRLASYQYRMTGPWTRPELTRLGWEPFAAGPATGAPGGTAPPARPPDTSGPASRRDNPFLD